MNDWRGSAIVADQGLARALRRNVDVRGDDECWPWLGSRSSKGYGRLKHRGRLIQAHRASYAEAHPEDDISAHYVCHRCDNPPCCNPRHLFKGDVIVNNRDKMRKGRGVIPESRYGSNGNAKLDLIDLFEIQDRIAAGDTNVAIARDYGVTHSQISRIRLGKSWAA